MSYATISQELVSREMPELSRDIQVLICGTKSFDKDMINYLLKGLGLHFKYVFQILVVQKTVFKVETFLFAKFLTTLVAFQLTRPCNLLQLPG